MRSVRFSSNGEFLICACFDGTSTVWTPARRDASGDNTVPSALPSGSDGADVCSGMHPWTCVAVLEGHENEVKCAAFDCTSTYIATCGRDKTVWIHQRSQLSAIDSNDIARLPRGGLNGSIEYFCAAILTGHTQGELHVDYYHASRCEDRLLEPECAGFGECVLRQLHPHLGVNPGGLVSDCFQWLKMC